MAGEREQECGLLHQILPPRLEDAGLDDSAPESIKQAFFKAASAVKSRASSIFASEDEEYYGCVNDPWPTAKEASDTLLGIFPENDNPGACAVNKGGGVPDPGKDDVVVGRGGGIGVEDGNDRVLVEGGGKEGVGKACVDELQGLGIREEGKNGSDDEEGKNDRVKILLNPLMQ